MQASKKSIMDIILGGYFVILGLMIVIVGLIASKKLSTSALPNSRDSLLEIFHTYDSDKDGFLEYQEFGDILKAWGANLSADDLELACYAVDQDCDEKISQQEFANWWESVQNFTPENSSTMV
jgi:Ca2+-binding EF-hand superfamily protein